MSDTIRQAIESWLQQQEEAEPTPYERVAHIVGSIQTSGNRSSAGGRRVAEILKADRQKRSGKP